MKQNYSTKPIQISFTKNIMTRMVISNSNDVDNNNNYYYYYHNCDSTAVLKHSIVEVLCLTQYRNSGFSSLSQVHHDNIGT
jgi:hypothetical protein